MFYKLLQKTRHAEAEAQFSRALQLAPRDAQVRAHYGLFLLDAGRNAEAGDSFAEAVRLMEQREPAAEGELHYESVFNAAVAFRLADKMELAERFYRRAVAIRPNVSKSYLPRNMAQCTNMKTI